MRTLILVLLLLTKQASAGTCYSECTGSGNNQQCYATCND
jgi:hypothetical protein